MNGNGQLLVNEGSAGITLTDHRPQGFIAKLTGSSGSAYSWTRQIAVDGGTQDDDGYGQTGTLSAYEINGTEGIANGTLVWMWPADGSQTEMRFSDTGSGGSGVKGELNTTTPLYGPEPTINFIEANQTAANTPATNSLGINLKITVADNPSNESIDCTLDNLGEFGRAGTSGTTYGPRRRINLIQGSGISISLADDQTDDELQFTITNSGSTATLTAQGHTVATATDAITSPISPWVTLDAANDLFTWRQNSGAPTEAILDLNQPITGAPSLLTCFGLTERPSWALLQGSPFGAGSATSYGLAIGTTEPTGNGWPGGPTTGGPGTPGVLNFAVSLIAYNTTTDIGPFSLWDLVDGAGGPFWNPIEYFAIDGNTLTLPSAGTYLIWCRYSVSAFLYSSPLSPVQIVTKLVNTTSGVDLPSGGNRPLTLQGTCPLYLSSCDTLMSAVSVNAGDVIQLYAGMICFNDAVAAQIQDVIVSNPDNVVWTALRIY
jgi:hypothetical protein